MQQRSFRSGIPGVPPPEVLIFFRIPKTGGNTMEGVFGHCMPEHVSRFAAVQHIHQAALTQVRRLASRLLFANRAA